MCLYVDDLIYTSNDCEKIKPFRNVMIMNSELQTRVYVLFLGPGYFNKRGYFQSPGLNTRRKFLISWRCIIATWFVLQLKKDWGEENNEETLKWIWPIIKRLVDFLTYLSSTRPNIVYSVDIISRFMDSPSQSHLQMEKRILWYIKSTINNDLFHLASKTLI